MKIQRRLFQNDRIGYILQFFVNFSLFVMTIGIYSHVAGEGAAGMTLSGILWSLFFSRLLDFSGAPRNADTITDDVASGAIAVRLLRPWHYLGAVFSERMGNNTVYYPLFIFYFLATLITVGWPNVGMDWWLAGPLMTLFFIGGSIIRHLLFFLIGLSAFWLEDAGPLQHVTFRLMGLLGGSLIPISFFGLTGRAIIEWTPFGAASVLAQVMTADFGERWPHLILVQAVWVVILAGALAVMWRAAVRRTFVNGG